MKNGFSATLLFLCTAFALLAQEHRATLLGVVTDASGAVVPGAQVNVANLATGLAASAQSTAEGNYVVPYLLPGTYRMRVEHPGFKTLERSPIELRVNDRVRVDLALEVGETSQNVTITAEAGLLEVSSAGKGQVIDNAKVVNLPLNSRNPFNLMNLATGVQYTGSLVYFRPFDNGAIGQFSVAGGRVGLNEFQIDGAPNNTFSSATTLAYVPSVEATQEFKVHTNSYDPEYGRTSGGIIGVSIKSGTNALHGAAYEYLRRTALQANLFANNATGTPAPERRVDQYGFEIDGPVFLPRLYSGKNRTFFMFSYEGYREVQPQPVLTTVPTGRQRAGDFSETFTTSRRLYTIYDPLTVTPNPAFNATRAVSLSNLRYVRTPFAGNLVPGSRMNRLALEILKDIPPPNQAGNAVTGVNNYFNSNRAEKNFYGNWIARVDHAISQAWRSYLRWNYNMRNDPINPLDNFDGYSQRALPNHMSQRRNDGAVIDLVGNTSPTTVWNARVSYSRSLVAVPQIKDADLASFGFPQRLLGQIPNPGRYPIFNFDVYGRLGYNGADRYEPDETYTVQASALKIAGSHSFKAGFEYRLIHKMSMLQAPLTFGFDRGWTRSNPEVDDPEGGNAIASMLLGYVGSTSLTVASAYYYSWHYPVAYFRDDWQVTRKLTLNLGLRWDYESPVVERFNRQNRGFDWNAKSPVPAPGLDLRGGLLFAGAGGQPRGAFVKDFNNWQPRAGLAYKLLQSKPLVFRAGFGRYFLPTKENGGVIGFTQDNLASVSTPDFLPLALLNDPFPNGVEFPAGAARGLATNAGDAVSFSDPNRVVPSLWQYSAGFQYELTPGLLMEASYVGSRTGQIQVSKSGNYLTVEQLALGTAYLSQVVANPFSGVLPKSTSRGAQSTIQRRALITQYPQFTNVTMENQSRGESWYNSLQLRLEQRHNWGLSYLVSYTLSKTMETTQFRNPQDAQLSRELVNFDVPQRFVFSGVYAFPVGPHRRWLARGLLSRLVGAWDTTWVTTLQSAPPMAYPDYYIRGNPKLDGGQTLDRWFNTSKEIWVQRPPDTLRVTPFRSSNIRRHTAPQTDLTLMREFYIREGHKFQFRVTAFNLTNSPIFNFPNTTPTSPLFGVVPITQINLPRSVELGFRYAF